MGSSKSGSLDKFASFITKGGKLPFNPSTWPPLNWDISSNLFDKSWALVELVIIYFINLEILSLASVLLPNNRLKKESGSSLVNVSISCFFAESKLRLIQSDNLVNSVLIIDNYKSNVDENLLYTIINQSKQLDNFILINSLSAQVSLEVW